MNRILIIDDEEAVCWALREALVAQGHAVSVAGNAELGLKKASEFQPHAILLDIRLPGRDGLSIMKDLQKVSSAASILVMTAFGSLETAVKAVELGAFDYLIKPFDLEAALEAVARALARAQVSVQKSTIRPPSKPDDLVGASPAMQGVFKRIALVAGGSFPVLITGESGTGKERVARAIHRHGAFREGPFLPVHISALDSQTMESELFGLETTGSGEGAASKPGLVRLAEGGSLFIDEIADVPLGIQVKLLAMLEDGAILPMGSNRPQPIRIRLLAATARDLESRVRTGDFRADLFYRLNVFGIALPALRERPGDIPLLASHFLSQMDPQCPTLPPQTIEALMGQSWPGNVRELRNALEHAAILARGGPILPEHLPTATGFSQEMDRADAWVQAWLAHQSPEFLHEKLLARVEPVLLAEVMRQTGGNRVQAAARLGINRATLRRMLERYGIEGTADPGE